jgi:AcrR family transcriptional regulator
VGRPSRKEQQLRQDELLESALDIFLERGFEETTMEGIAKFVRMSKRTVYAKYEDKSTLFRSAVFRAIDRVALPREALEAVATDDLEETLRAIARIRIANIANPLATKLQRILAAQSYRFPDLFSAAFERGTGPAIEYLGDLFAAHAARGEVIVNDSKRTALSFLALVVGGPTRHIVAGHPLDQAETDERIEFAVGLFLHGIRPR